ncbi:cysteine desulfurase family protein [Methylococcus mesophilus]|uniref:cysteine desulfurase family protein n=1 Tax=Methylococcus mesophilus TaxID=2993564 RepID=UPI00224B0C6C|nr:aminotransferase class V-fold PLP-dependent enzyme [Methylococcus mesophilus]UZR27316.1 aminotransferase class V-fold PLP-dependent enzyme [Methylococcus mesophilus]
MSETSIYLDNNATTPPAPECVEAMTACLKAHYGNPSSKHHLGEAAKMEAIAARGKVASLLGVSPAEIVFTSGGTESIHQAILGALALAPDKRRVVTSAVEHPATLLLLAHLEALGLEVVRLPVDGHGLLDPALLDAAITPGTALLSLMWANNETGVVFPIEEAAALAASRGVLFHCDAVQAVGKLPIDLSQIPLDFLSLSGHKLHGPKGIGALFVRKGRKLPPLLFGHQERGRRGSTENVPGIVGLGAAAELAQGYLATGGDGVARLRDRLETRLLTALPGASVNGGGAPRVAGTSSFNLGAVEAELVLDKLDRAGICASAGAACSAGGTEPSHVLTAMGLGAEGALATIRFSLSRYTTEAEVDAVCELLPDIVRTMVAEAA